MTAPLMGNLGLKSSTLAPVSSKLSTQYLVADHMITHYSKIDKAAAAVDSSPPKCLNTSQKLRDRRARDEIMKNSQLCLVIDSPIIYTDTFSNVPEYVTENLQYSQNTNTATYRPTSQPEASGYVHTQTWPVVSRDLWSSHVASPVQNVVARTYTGDLLDRRWHLFTQPKTPFIPRTHKNNHESRLRHSRCYNPPRIRHGAGNNTKHVRDVSDSHHVSKSDMNNILFLSQRGGSDQRVACAAPLVPAVRSDHGVGHEVPALAIPVDRDHAKWLKEQANKTSLRMHNQPKSWQEFIPPGAHVNSRDNGMRDIIKMETKKRSEENMYLSFAKEVTDDILSRGITSDSVLHRVFENQLERRKHDLDVNRMKTVIRDLCKRIGVREPAQDVQPVASLVASDYINKIINQQYQHHSSQHIQDQHHHVKDGRHSQRSGTFNHNSDHTSSSQDALTSVKDLSSSVRDGPSKASNSQDPICLTNDCTASSTLQSTSTLKFGLTTNFFSTVTSETDLEKHEALEERKDDDSEEDSDSKNVEENNENVEEDSVKLDEDNENVDNKSEMALTQALSDRLDDSSNLDSDKTDRSSEMTLTQALKDQLRNDGGQKQDDDDLNG